MAPKSSMQPTGYPVRTATVETTIERVAGGSRGAEATGLAGARLSDLYTSPKLGSSRLRRRYSAVPRRTRHAGAMERRAHNFPLQRTRVRGAHPGR